MYNFADLKLIDAIETAYNPKGLVALSSSQENTMLACPDKQKGYLRVINYEKNLNNKVFAHQSAIAMLGSNQSGSLLASASDKVSAYFKSLREL